MKKILVGYPAKVTEQASLPGFKPTKKSDFMVLRDTEGHLFIYNMTLCGVDDKEIMSRNEVTKIVYFNFALHGYPICPECEAKYKTLDGSPWAKWVGVGNYKPPEDF